MSTPEEIEKKEKRKEYNKIKKREWREKKKLEKDNIENSTNDGDTEDLTESEVIDTECHIKDNQEVTQEENQNEEQEEYVTIMLSELKQLIELVKNPPEQQDGIEQTATPSKFSATGIIQFLAVAIGAPLVIQILKRVGGNEELIEDLQKKKPNFLVASGEESTTSVMNIDHSEEQYSQPTYW
jgi:hypothetical protein